MSPLVLVVEDDVETRRFLSALLKDEDYEVLAAANGEEALALLRRPEERPPDVVLLDMWMPVMDGWAFLRSYRELPAPHAPVIAITAAHGGPTPTPPIEAHSVLTKPFGIEELLDLLRHYTGRYDHQVA
jgi:CheY-like chemotaxis protein